MLIIDTRSGRAGLVPGDVVRYGGGEAWRLLEVHTRLFSGEVLVEQLDPGKALTFDAAAAPASVPSYVPVELRRPTAIATGTRAVPSVEPGRWVDQPPLEHDERLCRGPNGEPRRWVPLQVRFLHPSFFLQHVGFIPT